MGLKLFGLQPILFVEGIFYNAPNESLPVV